MLSNILSFVFGILLLRFVIDGESSPIVLLSPPLYLLHLWLSERELSPSRGCRHTMAEPRRRFIVFAVHSFSNL